MNRILLVDNEADIALGFKIGLEDNGFIVDAFNDPELALSNFKAGSYDLLLLDIRMPKMDGFDLYIEQFKKRFPTMDPRCFVQKPITIDDLIKDVKTKLNSAAKMGGISLE